MNDFEKQLHGILDMTNSFWTARYIGRACYAPITEDLRIKAELYSTRVAAQYDALKLTAISNKNGIIDSLTLHFSDYFPEESKLKAFDTKKYIWTDGGKTEWYVLRHVHGALPFERIPEHGTGAAPMLRYGDRRRTVLPGERVNLSS